jgi:hypothetical protein
MKVRSHLLALVVLNEATKYALDIQIKLRRSEAENTYSSPPNKALEGATRTDPHGSTTPVQEGISIEPEQTNGDSSRRLPESESSAPRDLVGNLLSTIQSAPATVPAFNPASNSADSKSPTSQLRRIWKGQATEPSIGSKKSLDESLRQVELENTGQLGKIYDYKGTPRMVIFLIFISYGVAGVFSAILVGLIYVPGWLPYAFTMVWIVWYFWDIEMTCVLIILRNYSLIWKARRRTAAARAEGV